MIAVTARLYVKDGCEKEFEKVMLDLVSEVNINEPGALFYKLCRDAEGNYMVMELYEDETAVSAHAESQHVKAAGPNFKGIMSSPPEITRFEILG